MPNYEIKLDERERQAFGSILEALKGGFSGRCPGENNDLSLAAHTGYCERMCAKLFPSTLQTYNNMTTFVYCPCTRLSTSYKIKIVTKLLQYNGVKGV